MSRSHLPRWMAAETPRSSLEGRWRTAGDPLEKPLSSGTNHPTPTVSKSEPRPALDLERFYSGGRGRSRHRFAVLGRIS